MLVLTFTILPFGVLVLLLFDPSLIPSSILHRPFIDPFIDPSLIPSSILHGSLDKLLRRFEGNLVDANAEKLLGDLAQLDAELVMRVEPLHRSFINPSSIPSLIPSSILHQPFIDPFVDPSSTLHRSLH